MSAVPACAQEPEPAAPATVASQREPDAAAGKSEDTASSIDWRLAPISWGGNLGANLRLSGGTSQPHRVQDVETANIRARSYIWQPWFVQVAAGLGLVTSVERVSRAAAETNEGGVAGSSRNSTTAITGNLGLNVFPVSRFPFQLNYDVTDSRASGEFTGNDFQNRRLSVRQNYRPAAGSSNYVLGYDRSMLTSPVFGNDTVSALSGGVTRNWNGQNLDVNASRTSNTRSNTGDSSFISRLNARHNFRSDDALSVDTQASYSATDLHLPSAGLASATDTQSRFFQLNSVGTWRPEQGHPLSVVGSARLFQNSIANGGANADSLSLSGNIAANYRYTPHTTLFGSLGLTETRSDTDRTVITNQAAGVTYTPQAINIGPYNYTWNASGNVTNQTGGAEGGRSNLAGSLGHTLMRNVPLSRSATLSVSAAQSYSVNRDSVAQLMQTLIHNANVALRTTPTPKSSTYASLTVADARTFGGNENTFKIINLQVTGQVQLGRYSYGSANLTVQGTRQSTPTTPASGFAYNTSGNLTYTHTRAFDVPLLRYSLLFNANQMQFQSRLLGDVNAPREQVSHSLEQRLDYTIGRIEARLSARVARVEGRQDWLLFFSINRRFGDF